MNNEIILKVTANSETDKLLDKLTRTGENYPFAYTLGEIQTIIPRMKVIFLGSSEQQTIITYKLFSSS